MSSLNDDLLTRYVRGELDDAEQSRIEARMEDDPDVRDRVQHIREAETPEPDPDDDHEESGGHAGRWVLRGLVIVCILALGVGLLLPATGAARRTARMMQNNPLMEPQMPPAAQRPDDFAQRVDEAPQDDPSLNTETYDRIVDNPFIRVTDEALSTFSVDVDTASFAIIRQYIEQRHQLPPKDAVRIEELINYFDYDDPAPAWESKVPFAIDARVTGCPWQPDHRLARIAVAAKTMPPASRPPSNIVFLLDVSGSMNQPNKLPLVQRSMQMLAKQMRPEDRVAIVVYAG
ncbi:MAG: von Willebrand factor type A domain-containing protein, partial [Phycisphaeraceae bacterium]|nr:von Willebrand factor type A domain-containing protein [Phycisphaeraceae bacterium]